jgi:hypothetical protein
MSRAPKSERPAHPKLNGTPSKATRAAKDAALRAYAESGSRGLAAAAAGLSYGYFCALVRADKEFHAEMEDAHAKFVGQLEREAYRRAHDGWDEDRMGAGGIMYQVRRYSDALLMHLLKKNDPEKHGDKVVVDQTVKQVDPKELGIDRLSEDECQQLLELLQKAQGDGDAGQ